MMKLTKTERSILIDDAAKPYPAGSYMGGTFSIWCRRQKAAYHLIEIGLLNLHRPAYTYSLTEAGEKERANLLSQPARVDNGKLSDTQLMMLRRLYRYAVKGLGYHNTGYASSLDTNAGSIMSLEKRGYIIRRRPSELTLPAGQGLGGYTDYWCFTLSELGFRTVEEKTPVLIGDVVWVNGFEHEVISWSDDYQTVEFADTGNKLQWYFADPRFLKVKQRRAPAKQSQ